MKQRLLYSLVTCIAGLVLLVFISACAGVGGTNTSLTGSITSVDPVNHSVTVNAAGQSVTIKGLTDQEVAVLQAHKGKTYTIQVTHESDGSYQINSATSNELQESTPEANQTPETNQTPGTNQNQGVNEPGKISFIGRVQSASNGSVAVSLPDGSNLSMIINNLTDRSDFSGGLPTTGQFVKVEAQANTSDGSFTATKLKPADSGNLQDQSTVDIEGVTMSAVGSDHVIHFKVGSKSFSFPIASTADLSDFNGSAQNIQNNTMVKVKVQYSGNSGTVIKVSSSNGH